MSAPDERDGLAGIDNLTPFEYALAGVVPADGHDSPSLTVIDDMRRLADEMVDAPVTQARLRDFLETGGALARHDDRPGSTRRRGAHPGPAVAGAEISTGARSSAEVRSRTEGRFVDITPIELTQPVPSLEPTGEPAVVAGSEAVTAERSEIDRIRDALRSVIDTGPATGDSPAPEVGPGPGVEQEPEVPSPAKTETGPATSSPAPPALPSADPTADERAEPAAIAGAAALPKLFPDVPDAEEFRAVTAGAPEPLPAAEPVLTGVAAAADGAGNGGDNGADERAGGAILVPATAGAGASILEAEPSSAGLSATSLDAGASMVAGRFGTPVLALIATAAAAVVLAVGGLWWAIGLDDGDTEAIGDADTDSGGQLLAGDSAADGDSESDGAASTEFAAAAPTTDISRPTVSVGPREGPTATSSSIEPPTAAGEATAAPSETTTVTGPGESAGSQTEMVEPPVAGTAAPETTRTPAAPVTLSGRLRVGSKGLAGATVSLLSDVDNNQSGDQLIDGGTTDKKGKFEFEAPAGCFELRFQAPADYSMNEGQNLRHLCLEPGQSATVDVYAEEARPDPPSGCHVEPAGRQSWLGVEVFENGGNWADSYTFYGQSGSVVARTDDMGRADDVEGSANREWHARSNDFDHREVYSVAAERDDVESVAVSCQRD